MNITPAKTYNNNPTPSFSGQRLFRVNLLRKFDKQTWANIPAYFSKIEAEDEFAMLSVYDNWYKTTYGDLICINFLRNKIYGQYNPNQYFFMIENLQPTKEKNIMAIVETLFKNKKLNINFLQSRSELKEPKKEITLGGATMILYGLCKYAKQIKAKSIELISDTERTDALYSKLGFKQLGSSSKFYLTKKYYNKFIKNIEKKYFPGNFFIKNAKKN